MRDVIYTINLKKTANSVNLEISFIVDSRTRSFCLCQYVQNGLVDTSQANIWPGIFKLNVKSKELR